jgi:cystathionine beta-lyase
MKPNLGQNTQLTQIGRTSAKLTSSVNPPLVRASTTLFNTLADFKHSYETVVFESPQYGRSGTATTYEFQSAMAEMEDAQSCIAVSSGLTAIAAVLCSHAGPGDHVLVHEAVYGRTRTLCEKELRPLGANVMFFDSPSDLRERITAETRLVYIEVPSSLIMTMLDVEEICAIAHAHGVKVACDSTWGSPVFFRPHALGVDISLHSATKYINGHSDVMLGVITGSYESLESARVWCDRFGSHAAPDICWLALRGIRTLGVRMPRHYDSTLRVAQWLQEQPQVKKVMYPALKSDPGYALWKRQFSGASGLFAIELATCDEPSCERFYDALTLFGIGTSWGGFESLVMPAIPHHLRHLKTQPDEGRLVRIHVGLADPEDLIDDLAQALTHIC